MFRLFKKKQGYESYPVMCAEHPKMIGKLNRIEGENLAIIMLLGVILILVVERII